jgi:HlyD family secretion protein
MATLTAPKQRTTHRAGWITAGIVVIIVAIVAALFFAQSSTSAASTGPTTVNVTSSSITASVSGTGSIAAEQTLDLAFASGGSVTEVLVKEGDVVTAGQPLARLDTRDLALQVASAEANLESARARLQQQQEGNATPEQLAAQEASVASAQANLAKTRTNNVTAADIAEAEAQLRSAQAQLDDLLAGPKPDALASAQANYDQAVANLEGQRKSLAVAKERAQSDVEPAANTLRDSQDEYSRIYWDNRQKESLPGDLPQSAIDEEAAALRMVENNEEALRQAKLAYEQAQADEVTGIQTAESQLHEAETNLRVAREGATQTEIIQAQASVEQYRARLDGLRAGGTAADIAASQASLQQAQANLAELTAPATDTDLRIEQASIIQAEQSLAQAQLALEQATLTAPFGGVITSVDIVPGSVASGSVARLVNRDPLHVDLKLSENDVAKVAKGMPVTLTIDALRGEPLTGTVTYIATAAETSSGVVTYEVRVSVDDPGEQVKIGMTANLDIVYATKDDALLVPNSALLPNGAGYAVQVPNADGAVEEVPVTVGLSDGTSTEIVSGLSAGQAVIATPGQTSETESGGLFGN